MEFINLDKYYEEHHEYEFFINSYNLFTNSKIKEFIEKFNFLGKKDDEKKKIIYELKLYISDNLDEFNFLLVRLAIAIELSLKGLAVKKKLNIFKEENEKLLPYNQTNVRKMKTYELDFFIRNSSKLLDKEHKKYSDMFRFFQQKRNEFIHFSKRKYKMDYKTIIKNLMLVEEYFNSIIHPLKEESSNKVSKNPFEEIRVKRIN